MSPTNNWTEWQTRIDGMELPALIVDRDALRANIEALVSAIESDSIAFRVMASEVPCPALLRQILLDGASRIHGLACHTTREAEILAGVGFDDIFVLEPVSHAAEAQALARVARSGCRIISLVDHPSHLERLDAAATAEDVTLRVCIDVDIRRSPGKKTEQGFSTSAVCDSEQARILAQRVRESPGLRLEGIRTVASRQRFLRASTFLGFGATRIHKRELNHRLAVVQTLRNEDHDVGLVSGGDCGDVSIQSADPALTELELGYGCLGSTVQNPLANGDLVPAVLLALPISRTLDGKHSHCTTRFCAPSEITIHTPLGLRIANDDSGSQRLNIESSELAPEVKIGDPIIFRTERPDELLARFDRIWLISSEAEQTAAPTLRAL